MLRAKDDTEQYKNTQSQADISKGSSLTATGDINITAREQDITIQGSNVQGDNVNLIAKENINILAGENTIDTQNKADSKSAGVGVSIGIGKNNAGVGVSISGSIAKENSQEHITSYTPSTVNANKELTLKSGQDTNIIGSQVAGDKVTADIGGNLNIKSLQETNTYQSDSKYAGGSITIGSGAGIQASAGVGKMDSDYASVVDQAGIYAGKEGFDITVGKNTNLTGAVIDSNATPDKNKLDTGTITFSDIENKAEYSASNIGIGIDTRPVKDPKNPKSSGADKKDAGVTPDIGIGSKDDAKSTTKSGVAAGTIEVTDKYKQKQDINKLNRDTKNTLNKLEQIFDKQTVQERQELAKVFGEVAYKYIGDLSEQNKLSKDQQMAAHTIIGGIMAQLGGGDFLSGAAGAGVSKMLADEISKIKDPALRQWVSAAVGAAVGKVTGDAQSGSSSAASGRHNNDEAHTIQPGTVITLLIAGQALELQSKNIDGVTTLVDAAGNVVATVSEVTQEWISTVGDVIGKTVDDFIYWASEGTPGNNQAQNKQARDAANKYGLNKEQRRKLHDEITGQNYPYREVERIAKEIKEGAL